MCPNKSVTVPNPARETNILLATAATNGSLNPFANQKHQPLHAQNNIMLLIHFQLLISLVSIEMNLSPISHISTKFSGVLAERSCIPSYRMDIWACPGPVSRNLIIGKVQTGCFTKL